MLNRIGRKRRDTLSLCAFIVRCDLADVAALEKIELGWKAVDRSRRHCWRNHRTFLTTVGSVSSTRMIQLQNFYSDPSVALHSSQNLIFYSVRANKPIEGSVFVEWTGKLVE